MERKKYYLIVYLPELDPDPSPGDGFGVCSGCHFDTLEEAEEQLQQWRHDGRCPDECYQIVVAHLTQDELFDLQEEEEAEIDWDIGDDDWLWDDEDDDEHVLPNV